MTVKQKPGNFFQIGVLALFLFVPVGIDGILSAQAQSHFKGSVQVKDLQFAYEAIGTGVPLVMIHGFGVDRETMRGCMEPLFKNRTGWKRIYFDLPGMGTTKGPKWIWTSDHMLEAVREFIRLAIPGEKFALVGESYGGYLCRGIVHHDAANVLGMCLIAPMAVAADAERDVPPQTIFKRNMEVYNDLDEGGKAFVDHLVAVQTKEVWDRFLAEMCSGWAKGDTAFQGVLRYQVKNYTFSFTVDQLPQPFAGPSLILTGRQDSGVGYRDQYKFLEQYPRASFVILDMCGHILQIEQAGLFDALVNEWLDRVSWSMSPDK
jgi:pimeloyl-ACP methyl ester carboxylesterase